MAAKKKNLADHQSNIQKLLKEVEKEKKLLQEYENSRKSEIGKLYFELLQLDDKNINVDTVVEKLKEAIKNKKQYFKNKKNNQNTNQNYEEKES